MLSVDPALVTIVLLVAGIVMSFVPLIPGGLVSTLGITYYWVATDDLSTAAFFGFLALGVLTLTFDWLGSAISARAGGASIQTSGIAAVAAIALLFVFGPLGALLGVVGSVFLLEYRQHGDVRRGVRTAAVTAVGMLASSAMQVVLTLSMLVGFVLVLL